jgi:hypothetical protein
MTRVVTVVLLAGLTAFFSGVDNTSWAGQDVQDRDAQRREEHRHALASQLQGMRVGTPIEIERTRGGKVKAVFQNVTTDEITVLLAAGGKGVTQTIPLDEIKTIKKIGGHTARNVLIGVGVGVAALVGVCAASARVTRAGNPDLP